MTKLISSALAFAFIAAGTSMSFAQTETPTAQPQYQEGTSAPRSSQPAVTTKSNADAKKGMGQTTGTSAGEAKSQMDNKAPSANSSSNAK